MLKRKSTLTFSVLMIFALMAAACAGAPTPQAPLAPARTGDDPASSVVGRWGRAHDVPNLYVVDGSVFVTGFAVNPTSTIAAIAKRTATYIDEHARDQVVAASDSEVLAIYPHRTDVPQDLWERIFGAAERDIGVLVYAGLFLAEDAGVQKILADKARSGVRVRILLGDPDSPQVAERGASEGVDDAMAAKVRNALVLYRTLRGADGAEFRFHQTILYNSIYRGDDQLLVNTHVYGVTAARAPVWHLKRVAGGEIATTYLDSFERVWESATPVPE